jgi:hypothetical protein
LSYPGFGLENSFASHLRQQQRITINISLLFNRRGWQAGENGNGDYQKKLFDALRRGGYIDGGGSGAALGSDACD